MATLWSCSCDCETKEAAIEYALGPECPLPPGDYVTDSVAVDEDIEVEEE